MGGSCNSAVCLVMNFSASEQIGIRAVGRDSFGACLLTPFVNVFGWAAVVFWGRVQSCTGLLCSDCRRCFVALMLLLLRLHISEVEPCWTAA
jgi:hypothetical protein